MHVENLSRQNRQWMENFSLNLKHFNIVHGIILLLTFLLMYNLLYEYGQHHLVHEYNGHLHRFMHDAHSDAQTKVHKIGIFISCFYDDNGNSYTSAKTAVRKFGTTLTKTFQTGFEYNIYVGGKTDTDIETSLSHIYRDELSKINVYPTAVTKSVYSNTINELTQHALGRDFDYFVVFHHNAVLKWKYWATRVVRSLKGHCPSDFGIVVQECFEENQIVIVSKRHIELFGNIFPPNLTRNEANEWLISVYLPDHVTSLVAEGEHTCYRIPNRLFATLSGFSHQVVQKSVTHNAKSCVVSYSLFGSDKRYIDGAVANANLMKRIYPGWKMWLYHDSTVPLMILEKLCKQDHAKCFDMDESGIRNKMTWRFLVASAKNVSTYIIRNVDSRLDMREKEAVNEWLNSGKLFHLMRDHPGHNQLRINGGMWGGTGGVLNYVNETFLRKHQDGKFYSDMELLNKRVWRMLKLSVLQHDSYFCVRYGSKPFPTLRKGVEHVGSVYVNDKLRKSDTDPLKIHREPKECLPVINILEEL